MSLRLHIHHHTRHISASLDVGTFLKLTCYLKQKERVRLIGQLSEIILRYLFFKKFFLYNRGAVDIQYSTLQLNVLHFMLQFCCKWVTTPCSEVDLVITMPVVIKEIKNNLDNKLIMNVVIHYIVILAKRSVIFNGLNTYFSFILKSKKNKKKNC